MRLPDKIRERIGDLQGEIGIYYYDFNRDNRVFCGELRCFSFTRDCKDCSDD